MPRKSLRFPLGVALATLVLPTMAYAQNCIRLLVPLPCGTSCIAPGASPFGVIQAYFDCLYPYVMGTAAGVAILWCIISGAAMILYSGDDSKRTQAKEWFTNAVIGLLLIIFAAVIMNFINPLFFR